MDRIKRILNGKKTENACFITGVICCVLLIIFHALMLGNRANFYPINGTFQDFNPVRRFLDGQIPCVDFYDYLGLGHLYLGTLFTKLFGGTYRASLSAFSFLSFSCLALSSYIIGKAVLKNRTAAIVVTDLFLTVLMKQIPVFRYFLKDIQYAINMAMFSGNSARFLRGLILPVSCCLIYPAFGLKKKEGKYRDYYFDIALGMIAGLAFPWSNDYGISCWLCIAIIDFWIAICQKHKFFDALKHVLLEVTCSAITAFVVVEILTFGHFTQWLTSTFGTGGYQGWYYLSPKSYYIWEIDVHYLTLIQIAICLYYVIKMFIKDRDIENLKKDGIVAYANICCVCAIQEYKLLSGGASHDVAIIVLFITVLFIIAEKLINLNIIQKYLKPFTVLCIVVSVVVTFWIGALVKNEWNRTPIESEVYIEALDGYVDERAEDLLIAQNFLKDEKVFATYASAQEVVSGTFQPSGTDYIIHVLGDRQREEYIQSFKEDDFKYVSTINETFDEWERWIERANWFFYRELYSGWHPVFANEYEFYWERNNEKANMDYDVKLEIIQKDERTVIIRLITDRSVNGTGEVLVDYSVNKKEGFKSLAMFQRLLKVENTGKVYKLKNEVMESNYLRAVSSEYIPIPIVNGRGEITLTSFPEDGTYLVVNGCEYNNIYTVTCEHLPIKEIKEDDNTVMIIKNTEKYWNLLKNTNTVECQSTALKVKTVTKDTENIYLTLEDRVSFDLNRGNIIKIINNK